MSSYVFVYGTLRHRYPGGMAEYLRQNGELVEENAQIIAQIYALGGYPGVKQGDGVVVGDIYEIKSDNVLEQLDGYEGHPHLFERRQVQLNPDRTGWVYFYQHDVDGATLVEDGDWLKFRQLNKRS